MILPKKLIGKPSEWGLTRLKAARRFYMESLLSDPTNAKALREIPYLTDLIHKRKRQRAAKPLNHSTIKRRRKREPVEA